MYVIESFDDLDNFIIDNNDYVVLLYFGSTWCGPCKLLKQKLSDEKTLSEMPLLRVCYIDVDDNQDISSKYNINLLPTQIFIKLSNDTVKTVSRIEGYDYTKLFLEYNLYVQSKEK
jgi:thioredoxin 1